ncbi:MAG: hypothetical protein V1816_19610 [Pseudomonadota bacterium]
MNRVLVEGDIEFDFSAAVCAERFDDEEKHKLSHCFKRIDFLVEWPDSLWLVEVKDPSSGRIPPECREGKKDDFLDELKSQTLFSKALAPKLKDSFLYLHLNDELPPKPLKYFVFIGLGELDDAMLGHNSTLLKRHCCLTGPDGEGWRNPYITNAMVFNEKSWNRTLPRCPVRRLIVSGRLKM